MGIYIKGMTKPDDCISCDFCRDGKCIVLGDKNLSEYTDDETYLMVGWIPSCCPLVGVETPHGRLIDINQIGAWHKFPGSDQYWTSYNEMKKYCPPVIEAEVE